MKKFILCLTIPASILFTQCGGGSGEAEETEQDPSEYLGEIVEVDLTQHGYPLTIYVPAPGTSVPEAEIIVNSWGGIEVRVGKNFQILVAESDGNLQAKKEFINMDDVYAASYIVDTVNAILYEQKIKIEGAVLEPEFHFVAIVNSAGRTFEIVDIKEDKFSLRVIENMFDFALASKEPKPKS